MKFKRNLKYAEGLHALMSAPLVSVIFLLLIFFVLFSSYVFPPSIDVLFPRTLTSDVIAETNAVITITGENVLYWHNKIISVKALKAQLNQINRNAPVLIKADRRTSVGRIVEVWDVCRALGIERVNIATTRE